MAEVSPVKAPAVPDNPGHGWTELSVLGWSLPYTSHFHADFHFREETSYTTS